MNTNPNSKVEQLTVDFYDVDGGWLCFNLSTAHQTFNGRFSHVFDPLPDLKSWLEAISIGVQQTSFQYNPEGNLVQFDLERVSENNDVLTIFESIDEGAIFIKANINRKQIVNAFYLGLLTFASSEKFKSEEWEGENMKDRLSKMLFIDEEAMIAELVELDKNELGEILYKADPSSSVSFSTTNDKTEALKLFIEAISQNKNVLESQLLKKAVNEWKIPEEYNVWPTAKKREFVMDCLHETTQGYSGTKIDDFRSPIIEAFLCTE